MGHPSTIVGLPSIGHFLIAPGLDENCELVKNATIDMAPGEANKAFCDNMMQHTAFHNEAPSVHTQRLKLGHPVHIHNFQDKCKIWKKNGPNQKTQARMDKEYHEVRNKKAADAKAHEEELAKLQKQADDDLNRAMEDYVKARPLDCYMEDGHLRVCKSLNLG
jgi:hypothetical protein